MGQSLAWNHLKTVAGDGCIIVTAPKLSICGGVLLLITDCHCYIARNTVITCGVECMGSQNMVAIG